MDKQLIVNRVFNAPVEKVFEAFVNPDIMLQWYSPVDMVTPHVEVDLKVGGAYAITMRYVADNREVTVRGVYKEIDTPNKLVFTWKWDGQDVETEVTVELEAISKTQTALTLVQTGFEKTTPEDYTDEFSTKSHTAGWTTAFDKLAQIVQV